MQGFEISHYDMPKFALYFSQSVQNISTKLRVSQLNDRNMMDVEYSIRS